MMYNHVQSWKIVDYSIETKMVLTKNNSIAVLKYKCHQ